MNLSREIKFRMWDGTRMHITDFHLTCFGIPWLDTDDREGSEEERILMQYTGLKDKNGQEIYEGDIVEFSTRRYHFGVDKGLQTIKFTSVVQWEDGAFMVSEGANYNDTYLSAFDKDDISESKYTIIGNVYENRTITKICGKYDSGCKG